MVWHQSNCRNAFWAPITTIRFSLPWITISESLRVNSTDIGRIKREEWKKLRLLFDQKSEFDKNLWKPIKIAAFDVFELCSASLCHIHRQCRTHFAVACSHCLANRNCKQIIQTIRLMDMERCNHPMRPKSFYIITVRFIYQSQKLNSISRQHNEILNSCNILIISIR